MIGIDLVKVERISRIRAKFGDAFLRKFLTENEITLIKNDRSLAGFYAAKEAIAKALGTGIGVDFSFLDAQIYKDEKGAPRVTLAPKIVAKFGIQEILSALKMHNDGKTKPTQPIVIGYLILTVFLKRLTRSLEARLRRLI